MDRPAQRLREAGIPGFAAKGGHLGWWLLIAVSLVSFSRVAFFNPVLGVFVQPLEDEFGWSRATIAGALSAGTLFGALVSPFLGGYIDRYGGRFFMVGGIALGGVLLILLAAIDSAWQFYILFGAGRAMVTAILEIAIAVTIANWFIRGRGRATGLMLLGTRGAMAIMPLVILLFITLFNWRAAFAALGVLILVVAVVPPYLLVRRRPEDLGLRPDGLHGGDTLSTEPSADDPVWTAGQAVRTRAFWLLLFGTSQLFVVGGAVNFSLASHLGDNGLSQGTAVLVITVWAVVGLFGGLLGGEIRDRFPLRFALPVTLIITSTAIIWLIFVDTVWMAYAFAIWHGLAFGVQLPLNQTSFPDYFGRWSIGAIRGITAPVQFGLNAGGPLVAGIVFDARGSYDLIFAVFVGLLLFGALLIFFAKPPKPPRASPTSETAMNAASAP